VYKAQGFNPGNHPIKRFALKGREPLHVGRVLFPGSFRRPFRALRQGMLGSQGSVAILETNRGGSKRVLERALIEATIPI
jgi:hypothetical protein